ncbi:MAG TPA: Jag N-terminal domain-containing protein [Candidatus Polarisedimenticolaceae bacterium]
MNAREFEGNDLDEALGAASSALGRPVDELAWELVDEGRRGVFGLGARQVRVRVATGETHATSVPPAEPTSIAAPAPAPRVSPPAGLESTANRMLSLMGLRASASAVAHASGWTLRIDGPDLKPLLRNDGEVLEALEFLLQRMGRRSWPEAGSVRVECAGFRDRRDEELVALARETALAVSRTGKSEVLDELNPYERRLVHLTVRETQGVVSRSEGEGFLKRVRIERGSD